MDEDNEETDRAEGCLRRGVGTGFTASAAAAATGMTLPMWGNAFAVAAAIWFLMFCSMGGHGDRSYWHVFLENIEVIGPIASIGLLFVLPSVAAAGLGGLAVFLRGLGFRRTSAVMLILSVAVGISTLGACAVEAAGIFAIMADAKEERAREEEPAEEPDDPPEPRPAPRRGKGKRPRP